MFPLHFTKNIRVKQCLAKNSRKEMEARQLEVNSGNQNFVINIIITYYIGVRPIEQVKSKTWSIEIELTSG